MSSAGSPSKSFSARLGIDEREKQGVRQLFLHHFLQGLGISFFFTASVSLFLHEFGPDGLALSFVFGGLAMFVSSRIYAHFEHRISLSRFLPWAVLFLSLSALAVWTGLFFTHSHIALFIVFVLVRVLYLISSLEFWGLTSLMFDVRQGKRLFGVIGSGDIPAKLLGYLSVYFLVPYIGEHHLFLFSALFFAGSFFVARTLTSRLTLHHGGGDHHHGHAHSSPDRFLIKVFGNRFTMMLALFTLLSGTALMIIEFVFYGEVKLKFKKSEELSHFLSLFLCGLMLFIFVAKLLFSGRLVQASGVRGSLLIFVISLFLATLIFGFLPLESLGLKVILFFFAGLYALRDTLRFTLFDPVFLSLFQPLSRHMRLKGHTVIKGLVDALGLTLAGAVILLLMEITGTHRDEQLLRFLTYTICALLLLSLPALLLTHKEWIHVLRNAVRKRFLDGNTIQLPAAQTREIVLRSMASGKPGEVIYGLRLLQEMSSPAYAGELHKALSHTSAEVVEFALDALLSLRSGMPVKELKKLLTSPHTTIRGKALKALASDPRGWKMIPAIATMRDSRGQVHALEGLFLNPQEEATNTARGFLKQMLDSSDTVSLQAAVQLAGQMELREFEPEILRLIHHKDVDVSRAAQEAAVRIGAQDTLLSLLKQAHHGPDKQAARELLQHAGAHLAYLPGCDLPEYELILCRLLLKTRTKKTQQYLCSLTDSPDQAVRTAALTALVEQQYRADDGMQVVFMQKLEQSLLRLEKIAGWLHDLAPFPPAAHVAEALHIELAEEVAEALNLLACVSSPPEMKRARQGLRSTDKDLRADAIEIIDHFVPRQMRRTFTGVMEHIYLGRNLPGTRTAGPVTAPHILSSILRAWDNNLHSWTLSAVLDGIIREDGSTVITDADLPASPLPSIALQTLRDFRKNNPALFGTIFQSPALLRQADSIDPSVMEQHGVLTLLEKVAFLRRVNLFTGTPDNILAEVAAICREEKADAGTTLIRKGEKGDCMYILVQGSVGIEQNGQHLASLREEDFFGELSLLETEVRSADAVTTSDSLLLRIDQDDFFELIEDRVEVMRAILVTLAQRIRRQNTLIESLKK